MIPALVHLSAAAIKPDQKVRQGGNAVGSLFRVPSIELLSPRLRGVGKAIGNIRLIVPQDMDQIALGRHDFVVNVGGFLDVETHQRRLQGKTGKGSDGYAAWGLVRIEGYHGNHGGYVAHAFAERFRINREKSIAQGT